jgi:hypothetical protein
MKEVASKTEMEMRGQSKLGQAVRFFTRMSEVPG